MDYQYLKLEVSLGEKNFYSNLRPLSTRRGLDYRNQEGLLLVLRDDFCLKFAPSDHWTHFVGFCLCLVVRTVLQSRTDGVCLDLGSRERWEYSFPVLFVPRGQAGKSSTKNSTVAEKCPFAAEDVDWGSRISFFFLFPFSTPLSCINMANQNPLTHSNGDSVEKHAQENWIDQSLSDPFDVPEPTIHWRTWIVFFSAATICAATNYAVSSLGFWLGYTIGSLGGAEIAVWFPDGGFTVQVGLTALGGLIADWGPKTRKYFCVGLATTGSIGLFVAGSAKNMHVGIVGTSLYGFSLIGFVTEAAIVADIFPRRMRGIAQGNLYGIQALGAICANLGGGQLIKENAGGLNNGWRWNLYISAILQLIGCVLILVFYHPIPIPNVNEAPLLERLAQLDWVGVLLWCIGLTLVMIALIWGGGAHSWGSAPVVSTLVIGAVFFAIFIVHQMYIRKDGVFHHRLFKNRNFALAVFAIWVEGFVYITVLFADHPLNGSSHRSPPASTFISVNKLVAPPLRSHRRLLMLFVKIGTLYESRPVPLGAHFAVLVGASSISSAFWGYYSKRTKSVKMPLVLGFVIFIASCIGFSQCRPGQLGARLGWAMSALVGFGFGAPLALLLTVAQLAVDADLTALATAHILGIRSFGAILGSAIAGAVFRPKLAHFGPEYITKYALKAGVAVSQLPAVITAILGAGGAPVEIPGLTPSQIAAAQLGRLDGYAHAYSYIYYTIIPAAVLATVAVAVLSPVAPSMTWVIDAPVETAEALGIVGAHSVEKPEEKAVV